MCVEATDRKRASAREKTYGGWGLIDRSIGAQRASAEQPKHLWPIIQIQRRLAWINLHIFWGRFEIVLCWVRRGIDNDDHLFHAGLSLETVALHNTNAIPGNTLFRIILALFLSACPSLTRCFIKLIAINQTFPNRARTRNSASSLRLLFRRRPRWTFSSHRNVSRANQLRKSDLEAQLRWLVKSHHRLLFFARN